MALETEVIVTDVTKAELDSLVSGSLLEEGLQYNVTDKNWLLLATGVNMLKPLSGALILNNEYVPDYIFAETILIDTGIITTDISVTPFLLKVPKNYRIEYFDATTVTVGATPINITMIGDFTLPDTVDLSTNNYHVKLAYNPGVFSTPEVDSESYVNCTGVGAGQTIRFIFKMNISALMFV